MLNALTEGYPSHRFWDLRRDFDRLFDQAFGVNGPAGDTFVPEFDLDEDPEGLKIQAEIPGVAPEDLNVAVHGHVLTVEGARESTRTEASNVHRNERAFGRFSRSIQLPDNYDLENIEARHENGILYLRVPKHEAAKPRSIKIESK